MSKLIDLIKLLITLILFTFLFVIPFCNEVVETNQVAVQAYVIDNSTMIASN